MITKEEFLNLRQISESFDIPGSFVTAEVITNGNINSTYAVEFKNDGKLAKYILQRVNTYVFKNPEQIMSNIKLVTKHISDKIEKLGGNDFVTTLKFYDNKSGTLNYFDDGQGNFWRICDYIDSLTMNESNDTSVMKALGEAFGDFQNMLSDFDAEKLYETIPDFHNTKKRLKTLFEDAQKDEAGRAASVKKELDFFREYEELAGTLTTMYENGEIPARVTHNDTKLNNVLFDKEGKKPIAIIDLDTVMPGLASSDYGDAVRFACSTAAEDETDLTKISLDMAKFKAFTEGFVGKTAASLSKTEIETLPLGAITITIELASRFLDDYINGDKYFKTRHVKHNLERAVCQITLAKDMIDKKEKMDRFVKSLISK